MYPWEVREVIENDQVEWMQPRHVTQSHRFYNRNIFTVVTADEGVIA